MGVQIPDAPNPETSKKMDFFVSANWMKSVTWLVGPFDYLSSIQKVIWILHLFKSRIQMPLKYQISPVLGSSQCHSTSCVLIFRSLDSSLAPPKGWSNGCFKGRCFVCDAVVWRGNGNSCLLMQAGTPTASSFPPHHTHNTSSLTPHHCPAKFKFQIHILGTTHLIILLEGLCCWVYLLYWKCVSLYSFITAEQSRAICSTIL